MLCRYVEQATWKQRNLGKKTTPSLDTESAWRGSTCRYSLYFLSSISYESACCCESMHCCESMYCCNLRLVMEGWPWGVQFSGGWDVCRLAIRTGHAQLLFPSNHIGSHTVSNSCSNSSSYSINHSFSNSSSYNIRYFVFTVVEVATVPRTIELVECSSLVHADKVRTTAIDCKHWFSITYSWPIPTMRNQ